MRKPIGWFVAVTLLLPVYRPADAGTAAASLLHTINFLPNGVVIVYSDGSRSGAPACATQIARFAIDSTTPGGKSQLAGLLAAYAIGKPVVILGTGACEVYGDSETINYFYTAD